MMEDCARFNGFRMNKRGDVPTALLVVITLALSIAALFVFVTFNQSSSSISTDVSGLIEEVEFNYRFVRAEAALIARLSILQSPNKPVFQSFADERDFQRSGFGNAGNFFGRVRSGKFSFSELDPALVNAVVSEVYNLSVSGLFVRAESGSNVFVRNFDLCMLFDSSGVLIRDC